MLNNINLIVVFALIILFIACNTNESSNSSLTNPNTINDSAWVLNPSFEEGDVRRYGVFPDSTLSSKLINKVLDLGENGMPLHFPKGLYKTDLIIKGRKGISFYFDDAKFSGAIQIIDDTDKTKSKDIAFTGALSSYSKFFTRNSTNIKIDTLKLISDSLINPFGRRNLGCSIYAGTKNISITSLHVEDLGSGDKYYKFSHAALQIHGWKNNPENVTIQNVDIKRSDRHGAYVTGDGHFIKNLKISKVGLGDFKDVYGLEDALESEIDTTAALWLNRCTNSRFEKVNITTNSKADYSVIFDEGSSGSPTIIDTLTINNKANIKYKANDLTNIVVRHYFENGN